MRKRAWVNRRLRRRLGWLLVSLAANCFAAPNKGLTLRDAAVIPFFQKASQNLAHFAILLRKPVNSHQDLLVAMASTRARESCCWWGNAEFVGVFVQERQHPAQIFELALLPPAQPEDGQIRIQRASSTELVLARTPEKGLALESIELIFDIQRNKVNRQIRYAPFAVRRIIQRNGVPSFVATDFHESLLIRPNATGEKFDVLAGPGESEPEPFHPLRFGPDERFMLVEADGSRSIVERHAGKVARFPLPQSTVQQWAKARPDQIRNGLRPEQASISENIGPVQPIGNYLWFGKTFYDGEGSTGVGGFGCFDPFIRRYVLRSTPELRPWSVAALLLEEDALWLSLVHRGEYGDSSGGVLRWDRDTQKVTRYRLRAVATAIARYRGKLYFGTTDGIAILDGYRFRQFFVDGTRRVLEESY
jgi:hypothetical protein